MKATIYQVNIGSIYAECIESVKAYCDWYDIEHIVQTQPTMDLPPYYEKLNGFDYGKVLILDADVFITPIAPNIFLEATTDIAAVVERELPLTEVYREKIRKYSENYRALTDVDWRWNEDGAEFFNSGVLLVDNVAKPVLDERFIQEDYWNHTYDQTFLNWWVKSNGLGFKHLDWRWNVLYGAVEDIAQAYFVHFFMAGTYPQQGREIPKFIRLIRDFHQ